MKPYEAIGWTLLNTTAITNIVSTRVWHGLRPEANTSAGSSLSQLPCINYYEVGSVQRLHGIESATYSINCRAHSPAQARDLAREVIDVFHGSDSVGTHGVMNGFTIGRASLKNDAGLIPEPDDYIFNAPVDILLVYPTNTVS